LNQYLLLHRPLRHLCVVYVFVLVRVVLVLVHVVAFQRQVVVLMRLFALFCYLHHGLHRRLVLFFVCLNEVTSGPFWVLSIRIWIQFFDAFGQVHSLLFVHLALWPKKNFNTGRALYFLALPVLFNIGFYFTLCQIY